MADTHASHVKDKDIYWRRKRVWLPTSSHGWSGTALTSAHTGAPAHTEISTFGFGGLKFDAEGEEFSFLWNLPADADVNQKIYFRLFYTTGSSTATDTFTWKMYYNACTTTTGTIQVGETAISNQLPVDTYGAAAANYLRKTGWGSLNAGTLSNGSMVTLRVEMDASDATLASEYAYLFGIEAEYTPKKTVGPGMTRPGASNSG